MVVTFAPGVSDQQKQWINDAIAVCSYPFDTWDQEVHFEVVPEPPAPGHRDYMSTTDEVSTNGWYLVSIREGADDPASLFLQFLPNPQGNARTFFGESVIHEVMHAIVMSMVATDSDKTTYAGFFQLGAAGEGMRQGSLADWNPLGEPWADRIQEAVAEVAKDAFLPDANRVFDNRTNWVIHPDSFDDFIAGIVELPPGDWENKEDAFPMPPSTLTTRPGTPGDTPLIPFHLATYRNEAYFVPMEGNRLYRWPDVVPNGAPYDPLFAYNAERGPGFEWWADWPGEEPPREIVGPKGKWDQFIGQIPAGYDWPRFLDADRFLNWGVFAELTWEVNLPLLQARGVYGIAGAGVPNINGLTHPAVNIEVATDAGFVNTLGPPAGPSGRPFFTAREIPPVLDPNFRLAWIEDETAAQGYKMRAYATLAGYFLGDQTSYPNNALDSLFTDTLHVRIDHLKGEYWYKASNWTGPNMHLPYEVSNFQARLVVRFVEKSVPKLEVPFPYAPAELSHRSGGAGYMRLGR